MTTKERSDFYRARAKDILKLKESGLNNSQIGKQYGISRERVRKIINWVVSGCIVTGKQIGRAHV